MATNDYRRPDREWKCGLSHESTGCRLGPSLRGRCEEELCVPRRTLKWWRGYLPVAFLAVTLGTTLVLMYSQQPRASIVPGPLSMVHAQLIRDPNDPNRCANCHVEGNRPTEQSSFKNQAPDSISQVMVAQTQTAQCLNCHANSLPQMQSLTPHDLPTDIVEQLTKEALTKNTEPQFQFARFSSQPPVTDARPVIRSTAAVDWHQHALACSDCHREHQGSNHDLRAISSQRCQACHQKAFSSLASGHPEFSNYPRPQVEKIAFDHQRHQDLHFAKANEKFDCRRCHLSEGQLGRVGQVFRALSFEQSCASCHHEPMKASLLDGIIVFQLPSLNVAELKNHDLDVGPWPEEASLSMDGNLPPVMRMLLENDERYREILKKLPSSGELHDLHLEKPGDRRVVVDLANAIRAMLEEFARLGQVAIERRLVSTTMQSSSETLDIVAGLPPDIFRQAYRSWFEPTKNLLPSPPIFASKPATVDDLGKDELMSSDDFLSTQEPSDSSFTARRLKPELPSQRWKDLQSRTHLPQGGWMIDSQRMAIVYVPSRHADPWLTKLLTIGHQQAEDSMAMGLDSAATNTSNSNNSVVDFAHQFLATNGIGRCTECHINFRDPTSNIGQLQEQLGWVVKKFPDSQDQNSVSFDFDKAWRSHRADTRVRELTRFDHSPHLIQPQLNDCRVCHVLRTPSTSTSIKVAFEGILTPASPSSPSEFASIKKDDCASCHRPEAAGDQCIQCHNYHSSGIDYKYIPTKP